MTESTTTAPQRETITKLHPPPPRPKRWRSVMAVAAAAVIAGAATWAVMTAVTVSKDEHEELAASLEATRTDLDNALDATASLRGDVDRITADNVDLDAELEAARAEFVALDEAASDLQVRLDLADEGVEASRAAAVAILVNQLYFDPEYVAAIQSAGTNMELADALLERADVPWRTIEEYAGSFAVPVWATAIDEVSGDAAEDAFSAWLAAPLGSDEETARYFELVWQSWTTLLDDLDTAQSATRGT